MSTIGIEAGTAATATWQPLGPTAVQTPGFGLVTGRVTALALDPSDATGNRLYLGTTGGGVWVSQNVATSKSASVVFTPMTDTLATLGGAVDASISIGALTVQPGGTRVILAGTGDPNDVLDSYYGGGILRSTDGGNTWSLISRTNDVAVGLGVMDFRFLGEGFAGFAWSTVSPQLVVAAVSQAYEGTLVNAARIGSSYQGLYYSSDSGATWHLATITDGGGNDVQGPMAAFAGPHGNAATSVVWNPVRKLFVAAVRFHGYYQSTDGITWTRMTAQPGSGLGALLCPTNSGSTGSIACPIDRGTLAVNPFTGDTFAWTVDVNDQDQGLWQDQCGISSGSCSSQTIAFGKQWSTAALETNTPKGAATIADGSYTLALAAVPAGLGAGQDTLLLAGADDLWKCSLAMGCAWLNTTNSTTCKSAQVGMGFDFTVAASGSSSLTIAAGQTANYGVTINPANGARGTFTYTCGTLPANALCLFNPPTTTVSAGATGSVTVGISTEKATLARAASPAAWRMLPLACGLLLLPLGLVRRRKSLLLIVLLAVLAGSVSSCTSSGGGTGGGSGGSGSSSATPPGTYTVPVTVSSTGITHAVTLTMTVD
jgi:hypothetical protein